MFLLQILSLTMRNDSNLIMENIKLKLEDIIQNSDQYTSELLSKTRKV